jgi:hypothetical protein
MGDEFGDRLRGMAAVRALRDVVGDILPVHEFPFVTGGAAIVALVVPGLGYPLLTAVLAVLLVVYRRQLAGGILKGFGAGAGIVVAVVFALMVGPCPDVAVHAPRWFQWLLQEFARLMLLG